MTYRRRLALLSLALVALVALPASASARTAYVTGSEGGSAGGYVAPVAVPGQAMGTRIPFPMTEGAPQDVAITPDGKTAAVVFISGSKVVPIDVATNTAGADISVPGNPRAIAISPDGRFAYVTSQQVNNEVTKIDLATNAVVGSVSVGDQPEGIAITPDGKTAYVASRGDDSVYPVDLATFTVGAAIGVGNEPIGIAVTPNGARAYVVNRSGSTSVIDTATNAVVTTIAATPGSEIAISPSGAVATVVNDHEATAVDLATGTAGTPATTQDFLLDVAFPPDGSAAYLTGTGIGSPSGGLTAVFSPAAGTIGSPVIYSGSEVAAIAIVPNQPPHATFTAATSGLNASFSAAASADPDGTVARYDWNFGDGSSAANAGASPTHAFAKAGTYQVTVTETDNEGCSLNFVFTGQTAYCNGSAIARHTMPVKVGLEACPRVKASASTFVPKRRPAKVQQGVRVKLSTGVPAIIGVTATLIYKQGGKEATARLGALSVKVNEWRRIRFAIPAELREELPIGTPVKVALRLETSPVGGDPCESTVVKRTLRVHVVKVDPDRVQAKRPR